MTSSASTPAVVPAGPRAIDRVLQASTLARKHIVIPEWGGMELCFGKLTYGDLQAVEEREPKTHYERNLILLIYKARSVDGTPAFSMGDLHALRTEAEFSVVQRLVEFMYEQAASLSDASVQEAVTEIEANPSSASASSSPAT